MKKTSILVVALVAFLGTFYFATSSDVKEVTLDANVKCGNCKAKIEKSFDGKDGIESATVDVATKKVTFKYNSEVTNAETLKNDIAELGYAPVEMEKTAKKAKAEGEKECGTKSCCKDKSKDK